MNRLQGILALSLLLFGFAIPYAYQNADRIIKDCVEDGDYAANSLSVEEAKDFRQLLGPYSRFGFHHPGPLIFYFRAATEKALASFELSPYSVHNISQFILNVLSVFLMLLLLSWHSRSVLTPVVFFVFLWAIFQNIDPSLWFDTWGPYAVICSSALYVVSCAALMRGRSVGLIPLILTGSLILQTQVSTVAIVPLLAVMSFLFYTKKAGARRWKYLLWLSGVFLLVLWIPPLLDLISAEKNNISRLYSASQRNSEGQSFLSALNYLLSFYVPGVVKNKVMWFLGLFVFLWAIPLSSNKFYFHLRTLLTVCVLSSLVYALRIPGDLHPYLFSYHYAISSLCYGLLFVLPFEHFVRHRLSELFLTLLLLLFLSLSTGMYSRAHYNAQCSQISADIVHRIEPEPSTLYRIDIDVTTDEKAWARALGIGLELERKGVLFCLNRKWSRLFNEAKRCREVREANDTQISREKIILVDSRDRENGVKIIETEAQSSTTEVSTQKP